MASSNGTMRSSCPVGFEPVNLESIESCPSMEDVKSSKRTSLWLIKVPLNFDVSSLTGQNIIFNSSQELTSVEKEDVAKRYVIQSKKDDMSQLASFSPVLPSSQQKAVCAAGSLKGQINVLQSLIVPPSVLPEPQPKVRMEPTCLLQRKWKPFGYKDPPSRSGDEMRKRSNKKKKKKNREKIKEGEGNFERSEMCSTASSNIDEHDANEKRKGKRSPAKENKAKNQKVSSLARVKTDPAADSDIDEDRDEEVVTPSKKRKEEKSDRSDVGSRQREKRTSKAQDAVKVKKEVDELESPGKRSSKHKSEFEKASREKEKRSKDFDFGDLPLVQVKIEPVDTPSKGKKKRKK